MSLRTRSFKEVYMALCGEKHANASLPVTQYCRDHLVRILQSEKVPFDHWELIAAAMRGCWVADCSYIQIRLTPASWPQTALTAEEERKNKRSSNSPTRSDTDKSSFEATKNKNDEHRKSPNPLTLNVFDLPWEKLSVDTERKRPTVLARVSCGLVQLVQSSPHLRTLELSGVPFGDDNVVRICTTLTDASRGPFDAVENVILANVQLHDESTAPLLQCLKKLPSLTAVSLAGNYLTDASGVELIKQFLKIPSFSATRNNRSNNNSKQQHHVGHDDDGAGTGRIKILDLSFNEFSDALLVQLADALEEGHGSCLEQLNLNGNHFKVIGHMLDILESPVACPPNLMKLQFSGLVAESLPESIPEGKWRASFDPESLRLVFTAPKLIQKAKEEKYSRLHHDFTEGGTRTSVLNATTAASRSRKGENNDDNGATSQPPSFRFPKQSNREEETESAAVHEAEQQTQAALLKKAQDRIKKYQQLLQKGRDKDEELRRGSVANQVPPPEKRRRPSSAKVTATTTTSDQVKKQEVPTSTVVRPATAKNNNTKLKPKGKPVLPKKQTISKEKPKRAAASSSTSSSSSSDDISSFHDSSASPTPVKPKSAKKETTTTTTTTTDEQDKQIEVIDKEEEKVEDEFEKESSTSSANEKNENPVSVAELITTQEQEAKSSLLEQSEKDTKKQKQREAKKNSSAPKPKPKPKPKQQLPGQPTVPARKPAVPKQNVVAVKAKPQQQTSTTLTAGRKPVSTINFHKSSSAKPKLKVTISRASSSSSNSSTISSVHSLSPEKDKNNSLTEEEGKNQSSSPSPGRMKKVWKKKIVLVAKHNNSAGRKTKRNMPSEQEKETSGEPSEEISANNNNNNNEQQHLSKVLLHHIEEMFEEIQTNHDIEMSESRKQLLDLHQQLQQQQIGLDEQERRFKNFANELLNYEEEKSKARQQGKREIIPLVVIQQQAQNKNKLVSSEEETRRMFAAGIRNLMWQIIGNGNISTSPSRTQIASPKPAAEKKPTPQELNRRQQIKKPRTASSEKVIGDVNSRLKQLGW